MAVAAGGVPAVCRQTLPDGKSIRGYVICGNGSCVRGWRRYRLAEYLSQYPVTAADRAGSLGSGSHGQYGTQTEQAASVRTMHVVDALQLGGAGRLGRGMSGFLERNTIM